ncbi:MAG: phosphotransferase family protein [Candidatus Sericytochromatia bacterium]
MVPSEQDATAIVNQVLAQSVLAVSRFTTGLCHYVYEVLLADGTAVVARLARPDAAAGLAGAVYWSERLRPLGVPLPELLAADARPEAAPCPYLLLERLPGTDLGHVYDTLSSAQKRAIAAGVVDAQRLTARLPPGRGFGYVSRYDQPFPWRSWQQVVLASLARSRERIVRAGVFDSVLVDAVTARLPDYAEYLAAVTPTPFLDDTTTKNVLVHQGALSGIVDVDVVCFGDPLWTLGLTRMALLSGSHEPDYADIWAGLAGITAERRQLLNWYTAVFCVDFMSEVGQRFNQQTPLIADRSRISQLKQIHADLMRTL